MGRDSEGAVQAAPLVYAGRGESGAGMSAGAQGIGFEMGKSSGQATARETKICTEVPGCRISFLSAFVGLCKTFGITNLLQK
jgi:hypothetical protein